MKKHKKLSIMGSIIFIFLLAYATLYSFDDEYSKAINLSYPINTTGDDFSPSITGDGKILVFNSKELNEKDHNIYICEYEKDKWSKPKFFKILNSHYNEETPFISEDGKIILFASDRPSSLYPSITPYGVKRTTFDIFISKKINGRWTKPERIPGDVNTIYNERSPSLSPDNKVLFFTRWPYQDIKDSKIKSALLDNGKWKHLKDLPKIINSGNYEVGFYPSRYRSGFYFSSRRSGGYGGWDLYFVSYKDGAFKNTINLGRYVNTEDNEFIMTDLRLYGYFCSNRWGGLGKYDNYMIKLPSTILALPIKKFTYIYPKYKIKTNITNRKKKVIRIHIKKKEKFKKIDNPRNDNSSHNDLSKNSRNSLNRNSEIYSFNEEDRFKEKKKIEPIIPEKKENKKETTQYENKNQENNNETINDNKPEKKEIIEHYTNQNNREQKEKIEKIENNTNKDINKNSQQQTQEYKKTVVIFRITNQKTGEPLSVKFKAYLKDENNPRTKSKRIVSRISNDEGIFKVFPRDDVSWIIVKLDQKGYASIRKAIKVNPEGIKETNIQLYPTDFILRPIFFDRRSSEIKTAYLPYIHKIINYMRNNRSLNIRLVGYGDKGKRDSQDLLLAKKRVFKVAKYIAGRGIAKRRIHIKWTRDKYRNTRILSGEYTQINMRVDFYFIK